MYSARCDRASKAQRILFCYSGDFRRFFFQKDFLGDVVCRKLKPFINFCIMDSATRHDNVKPRLDCLPSEVLQCIIAYVQPLPEVPVEHRAWFSSVSLQLPPPQDISNDEERESPLSRISRVSRNFRPVVQKHLFKWVVIRFSKEGFDRLEKIASTPHLALVVRRLSYMVRRTYLPGKQNRSTWQQDWRD